VFFVSRRLLQGVLILLQKMNGGVRAEFVTKKRQAFLYAVCFGVGLVFHRENIILFVYIYLYNYLHLFVNMEDITK
jgi:hypothetical protein